MKYAKIGIRFVLELLVPVLSCVYSLCLEIKILSMLSSYSSNTIDSQLNYLS